MQPLKSFTCSAIVAAALAAPLAAEATTSINLIYDGPATANARQAPTSALFNNWCAAATGACFPTVQQPVFDMSTGQQKGTIYVWGAFPFNAGPDIPTSFCFSEFFIVALAEGDLYAYSGPNGTCGATMDPAIKPPRAGTGADVVIAGGGDGVIAGGTGKFRNWTGTFTDRVFVGFGSGGVSGIIYYDSLIFSFTGK